MLGSEKNTLESRRVFFFFFFFVEPGFPGLHEAREPRARPGHLSLKKRGRFEAGRFQEMAMDQNPNRFPPSEHRF